MIIKRNARPLGAALLLCASAQPAFAHHAMDGDLPATLAQGLVSGLAHPVIGLDHLAFVIGVGLASAFLAHRLVPVLCFVAATLLGCALHVNGVTLPYAEAAIALSVLALGAAVMSGRGLTLGAAAALFAAAGLFHGYAYGESIVGAEQTPLAAYLAGFAAIQAAIAGAAMLAARHALRERLPSAIPLRLAGAAILGVGLSFAAQAVESAALLPGGAG